MASLRNELALCSAKQTSLKQAIGSLTSEIASTRSQLVEAEAALKDDQLYMKDLTELCEERAKDYDQRSAMRKEELEALTKALAVLTGVVAEKDQEANQRAQYEKDQEANQR